jgi:hypothetical protein
MKISKIIFIFIFSVFFIIGCKKDNSVDTSSRISGTYSGTFTYGENTMEGTVELKKQSNTSVILNETLPGDTLLGYSLFGCGPLIVAEGDNGIMYFNNEDVKINGIVNGVTLDYTLKGHHFTGTRP